MKEGQKQKAHHKDERTSGSRQIEKSVQTIMQKREKEYRMHI